ncbi:hypothetical protein [Rhodopirellula sallentina]|uniref:Uncharacterized protein n=1 Tax=Rhodopirellula sallentina SM41 TaxID=1263870 RepID=M5U7J4_9BACT|nr:hypothetical protein [Rhodopirellula sallentina]EMI57447.1 hypothetical protein RSSM_01107 [Rhodopirellula sallentina SM41]
MNHGRGRRRRLSAEDVATLMDQARQQIAKNLGISPDRIRYGPMENNRPGRLNTQGDHWQIHYQGEWKELPWHHDGPLQVTRTQVRNWYGDTKK